MTEEQYHVYANTKLEVLSIDELTAVDKALTHLESLPLKLKVVITELLALRLAMYSPVISASPELTRRGKESA